MSLPVRSCLCRRHSERFEGPLGPRQWLRLLRRSTCSKRGSVRGIFFIFSLPFGRIQYGMHRKPKSARFLACPRSTQVHVQRSFRNKAMRQYIMRQSVCFFFSLLNVCPRSRPYIERLVCGDLIYFFCTDAY